MKDAALNLYEVTEDGLVLHWVVSSSAEGALDLLREFAPGCECFSVRQMSPGELWGISILNTSPEELPVLPEGAAWQDEGSWSRLVAHADAWARWAKRPSYLGCSHP